MAAVSKQELNPSRVPFSIVTRSMAGSVMASAISRCHGHSFIGPGAAPVSGQDTFASIHAAKLGDVADFAFYHTGNLPFVDQDKLR